MRHFPALRKIVVLSTAIALFGVLPATGSAADGASADGKPPGLESRLYRAQLAVTEQGAAAGHAQAEDMGLEVQAGKVVVEVYPAGDLAAAIDAVEAAGGTVAYPGDGLGFVGALVPMGTLMALSEDAAVRWVQSPPQPFAEAVTGQGVAFTDADDWHAVGITGAGVKVAVVDLGFTGYASAQASGDLPATLTTQSYCGGGIGGTTAHGTAVAEIVHEMAPDAEIYLICVSNTGHIDSALDYMNAQGVDIISHSVGWFNTERGDGTGPFLTLSNKAEGYGIAWFNSAGNYAERHWSGNFNDSNDGDGTHEFSGADERNTFTLDSGDQVYVSLKWDEWPTSSNDFDLYLLDITGGGGVVDSSTDPQTGTQPPTELITYTNPTGGTRTYAVEIREFSAMTTPDMDLFVLSPDDLEYPVTARSLNENSTVPNIYSAGAVWYFDGLIEDFSSEGPTIDGRTKPDISGPDGVASFTYGSFGGTSASAPHVSGAAALLLSVYPWMSPAELRAAVSSRTHDAGPAGPDNEYGVGVLDLGAPPAVSCAGQPVTIVGTENDDVLVGTDGRDVIAGLGGNDHISGFDGGDLICGGAGNDRIYGGKGNDTIFGDTGVDLIWGNQGKDVLDGGKGNDKLIGSMGLDRIMGRGGNDVITGNAGDDGLRGGVGDDYITGDEDDDHIYGNGDDDTLSGGAGSDIVYGGPGNDLLRGNSGSDELYGGSGTDVDKGGTAYDYCTEAVSYRSCEVIG